MYEETMCVDIFGAKMRRTTQYRRIYTILVSYSIDYVADPEWRRRTAICGMFNN